MKIVKSKHFKEVTIVGNMLCYKGIVHTMDELVSSLYMEAKSYETLVNVTVPFVIEITDAYEQDMFHREDWDALSNSTAQGVRTLMNYHRPKDDTSKVPTYTYNLDEIAEYIQGTGLELRNHEYDTVCDAATDTRNLPGVTLIALLIYEKRSKQENK